MIERLRKALFSGTSDVDRRMVMLISLAHGSGLLKQVFDKKELKGRKERIKRLIEQRATSVNLN